jgi:hypothetical protein
MITNLAGSPIYTLEIAKNYTLISINNFFTRMYYHLYNNTLTDIYTTPMVSQRQNIVQNITIAC